MAHVKSVAAAIGFYAKLGFRVDNTFTPDGASEPSWAWLESEGATLMVAKASAPVVAGEQAVLFYLYCQDVPRTRDALIAAGISCGEISRPFFAPRGQFRVEDPDGYVLMIMHT